MSVSKFLIILLAAAFLSCQEAIDTPSVESPPAENKHLISTHAGDVTSKDVLQLLASGFGESAVSALLKHDVQTYTITYSTVYKGKAVEASGLIMIPVGIEFAAGVVSLQHGTEFQKANAPSAKGGFQGVEFLASAGYVALMPDFLGYGSSAEIFHPYYDRTHAASTVIDLIKAAKEFLHAEQIDVNEKLFLAGYSEGGYVTLAAAREIDANPAHELEITAVAAGAGGYALPEMLSAITSQTHYTYPGYLAFFLMAYNETNDWKKPLTYYFKENYANALTKVMDGTYGGSYINSKLTTHVPTLFNASFYEGLKAAEGETELKTALEANSVGGWRTDIPIRLFHGTKDEIIPYENSEITLEKFKAAGSPNVTLTLIPGGTHSTSMEPMVRNFIPWFLSLK